MADETKTPKHPAGSAKGAGTSDAAAPGGAEFDVDNATPEDFDKHAEILRRRSLVAGLTPAPMTELVADATPSAYVPSEPGITKIDRRNGNPQTLPAKAWALLSAEDLAEFDDAPVQPAKPSDLN